jgi:hypothetical protein
MPIFPSILHVTFRERLRYNLRSLLERKLPDKGKYNDYGEDTVSKPNVSNVETRRKLLPL